jgi:adenosylmethionine-8-amino-7-oxononanoate aminotransferase
MAAATSNQSSLNSQNVSANFGRNLVKFLPKIAKAEGCYLYTEDGRCILDGSSGAAVACLGYKNARVQRALRDLEDTGVSYLASSIFGHESVEQACSLLAESTGEPGSRAYLACSGSEVTEATLKLAKQYFHEKNENSRVNFISRKGSYHGNTLAALSVSGFPARTEIYDKFLLKNVHKISSCNPYHQQKEDEKDTEFVQRKAEELEGMFQKLGPDTVIGFIAEPIVGAALGCVPSVPGYLRAMRDICHKHGALFILDEVMCGMGRTGTLHAWQAENVRPDLQTVGKGLAGGYESVSALLVSEKVVSVILNGSQEFKHGLTFQAMPKHAVAVLEVQRIIREDRLLDNVSKQGSYLEENLKRLMSTHPNVGNIRGKGLFWGIEFVKDKATKQGFSQEEGIAYGIARLAISPPFNLCIYPCAGNNDGMYGDRIIIAPPFIIKREEVEILVTKLHSAVAKFFSDLHSWFEKSYIYKKV